MGAFPDLANRFYKVSQSVPVQVGEMLIPTHLRSMQQNNFVREFLATIDARFSEDSSKTTMAEWITKNTHLKKRPFSFAGFDFQEKIINDLHPDLSVKKPSQVGLTESQLRKYLAFLRRNTAVTGIYTMPDDKMRDRVSQTRVKPMVDTEAVFNPPAMDKPVRQKGLYQIDASFAYFTGSTEGDATSIPADILFHDELDLTDQQMIGLFQSRLQMSKFKIRQQFSTPTYYGYGIDAAFTNSDQHEYMIRCSACRHWQLPTFHPKFISLPGEHQASLPEDLTTLTIDQILSLELDDADIHTHWRCESCSRPLDLGDASLREWVAKHPGRRARGYNVRPTSVNTITIPYIFDRLKFAIEKENLKSFHNTVLGEPYNDSNARISEADIKAVLGSQVEPEIGIYEPCFVGIDVGVTCHIVLGTSARAIRFQQVPQHELIETVKGLYAHYNIISGCMDRYPYTPTAEAIRDIDGHKNVIMPIGYATQANAPPLHPAKDEFQEITHWVANRTRALDTVASLIRNSRVTLEGYGSFQSLLTSHLRDMVRIETPDTPPIWNKITGQDHFFHALSYMLLAQRLIDATNFKSDIETRTHFFLIGSQGLATRDLSPRSLNRVVASDLGNL